MSWKGYQRERHEEAVNSSAAPAPELARRNWTGGAAGELSTRVWGWKLEDPGPYSGALAERKSLRGPPRLLGMPRPSPRPRSVGCVCVCAGGNRRGGDYIERQTLDPMERVCHLWIKAHRGVINTSRRGVYSGSFLERLQPRRRPGVPNKCPGADNARRRLLRAAAPGGRRERTLRRRLSCGWSLLGVLFFITVRGVLLLAF